MEFVGGYGVDLGICCFSEFELVEIVLCLLSVLCGCGGGGSSVLSSIVVFCF